VEILQTGISEQHGRAEPQIKSRNQKFLEGGLIFHQLHWEKEYFKYCKHFSCSRNSFMLLHTEKEYFISKKCFALLNCKWWVSNWDYNIIRGFRKIL